MKTSVRRLSPLFLVLLFVLAFLPGTLPAQDDAGTIQQMMSPQEFKAAGLDKLSPEELSRLNAWLKGYRETTVQATEIKATKEGRRKVNLIVSRVVGPFYGLTGHTIIRLEDGSAWKQANHNDLYKGPGLDHLGVAVVNAGLFGYKMRIEGTPEFYVDQVKNP